MVIKGGCPVAGTRKERLLVSIPDILVKDSDSSWIHFIVNGLLPSLIASVPFWVSSKYGLGLQLLSLHSSPGRTRTF